MKCNKLYLVLLFSLIAINIFSQSPKFRSLNTSTGVLGEIKIMPTTKTNEITPFDGQFSTFPNPANHQINILLETKKSEQLTVKIYTITGNLVATLCENASLAAGEHSFFWNTEQQSNVYIVKVSTPSSQSTKKIIVIKQ